MKILIYFLSIVFFTILGVFMASLLGITLGPILVVPLAIYLARVLCKKWDEYKAKNKLVVSYKENKNNKLAEKILSVMPHSNPPSPIEQLTLDSILYSFSPDLSPSYARNNNYVKLDTLIFTIFMNRTALISSLTNKDQENSAFNDYLNLCVTTASHFLSITAAEFLCMVEDRTCFYNTLIADTENDLTSMCDAYANIILNDFKNKYTSVRDLDNMRSRELFQTTKELILDYISKTEKVYSNTILSLDY